MATLRVEQGKWILDYRKGGLRQRKTLGPTTLVTKRDAERVLKETSRQLSAAYNALASSAGHTLTSFTPDYLAWHAAEYPASHERVEQILTQHLLTSFGHLPLAHITPQLVEEWKRARSRRVKAQTVVKELRTLKAVLNRATAWGHMASNPIQHVAAPRLLDSKPPSFFSAAELQRLYAACRVQVNTGCGAQPNPEHAHWWRLYANTGLRRAEGLMLRWDWIEGDRLRILSTEDDRTKSGRWREVPLSTGAQEALAALPRRDAHVLPRITLPSLSRACARDIKRAGLTGSLHTLRHTYISHLVMQGVPLRTVQVLAGHSTVAVTEKYAHIAPDHLAAAVRGLGL